VKQPVDQHDLVEKLRSLLGRDRLASQRGEHK